MTETNSLQKLPLNVPLDCYVAWDGDGSNPRVTIPSDFTFFLQPSNLRFAETPFFKEITEQGSYSGNAILEITGRESDAPLSGRILACLCEGRSKISVTIRLDFKSDHKKALEEIARSHFDDKTRENAFQLQDLTGFRKRPWGTKITSGEDASNPDVQRHNEELNSYFENSQFLGSDKTSDRLPVSIRQIAQKLHNEIFLGGWKSYVTPQNDSLHGAVLIAGRTKSAKSLVTRALIHEFLSHGPTYRALFDLHERTPHLITCEDPIEVRFCKAEDDTEKHPVADIMDYTPRDRTARDYTRLRDTFSDALRQTPACMFIGEVRELSDLNEILEFAGTGHLVIATLHAGSLCDVFTKVFEAADVKTSSDRGLVGQRILGAIHLKQVTHAERQVVLPTMWRRTPASTAALVASGVGSLTPNLGKAHDCLGRQYFANQLLSDPELRKAFREEARAHDLRGE